MANKECEHPTGWYPHSQQMVVDANQGVTRITVDNVYCPKCLVVKRFAEAHDDLVK